MQFGAHQSTAASAFGVWNLNHPSGWPSGSLWQLHRSKHQRISLIIRRRPIGPPPRFETVSQSAACNRLHVIEQRCARWLLMSQDRVGRDQFDLTQEFLAEMLGVRRPGVTVAMGILQKAGLITHGRGNITVIDRPGLERAACECYQTIRSRQAELINSA